MKKFVALSAAVLASGNAMAVSYTDQITAAQTDATGNVTAVIAAVIAVAAIGFGAHRLVSWLNR